MKKAFVQLLLIILLPLFAAAATNTVQVSAGVTGGGTTYVGYPNTDGEPDSTPGDVVGVLDTINTTKWTADVNGTVTSIRIYVGLRSGTVDYEGVVLYRGPTATPTLIGQGLYTGAQGEWTDHVTVVAEPGESLDFSIGDILYFGGCGSSNNTYKHGRNATGGTGMWYNYDGELSSGPPASVTLYESTGREMGFIMGYTQ